LKQPDLNDRRRSGLSVVPDAPPSGGVVVADVRRSSGSTCLADVDAAPVDWLWRHRVPLGAITLLDGDPGLGKSTIAYDLAARVTAGAAMPDGTPGLVAPAAVLVTSVEDSPSQTIRPRIVAAGGVVGRVFLVDNDDKGAPFVLPDGVRHLESLVIRHGAKLVIMDPIDGILSAAHNSNSNQEVRAALRPLDEMLRRHKAAAVLIRHLNKKVGASALHRGGGSIAFAGAARSVLLLAPRRSPGRTGRVLAQTKSNCGPPAPSWDLDVAGVVADNISTSRIKWEGASADDADDLVDENGEQSSADEAIAFLRAELADGPKMSKEMTAAAKDAGVAGRTVERVKRRAGVISERVGTKWWWRLARPGELAATAAAAAASEAAGKAQLGLAFDSTKGPAG
jgi:hypothetical protein